MAGLHDYTTKEVLNKVLLDSSGNAVAAFSHTTQEALNAVLDTTNNRLNVSIAGGTISGDVTIAGDLTVNGGGDFSYSEVLTGDMKITNSGDTTGLEVEQSGSGQALLVDMNKVTSYPAVKIEKLGSDRAIHIDHDMNIGTGVTSDGILLDYDKTQATTGGTAHLTGVNIQVSDATDSSGGTTVNTTGLKVTMDISGGTKSGTHNNYAAVFDGGYVGIGGDPTTSLDVNDNGVQLAGNLNYTVLARHSSLSRGIALGHDGGSAAGFISAYGASNALIFATHDGSNYGERMRLTSSGILQMTNSTINGAPINLLSRDTAVDTNGEGVRIRFGKSDDGFLADFGYRRQEAADKGATVTSTDNLRFVLAGQDVSHFMLKGGNSTTGASMDIRTHETTVVANDVLGKITFSAPYESSGTDAISAGAEIKAIAASTFDSADNNTSLIFSTASSDAVHGSATDGAVFQRFVIDANSRISLSNNDSGESNNTVFGKSAFNVSGDNGSDYNTAVGELAMGTNAVSGSAYNVALGYKALTEAINCDFNIAIGANSMLIADNGESNNISIGTNAMNSIDNSASDHNVVIGDSALLGGTGTVKRNIAIGSNAMGTGVSNNDQEGTIAIGYDALIALTSGAGNTAIGYQALKAETVGNSSTAVGYYALHEYNKAGTGSGDAGNTAIGTNSMRYIDHADAVQNTAVGMGALQGADADGNQNNGNVAIGYNALNAVTDGSLNVAIGANALDAGTTATSNVAIGKNALGANQTGGYTIAIGRECFSTMNDDANDGSIGIGYAAGKNISASGAQYAKINVLIGRQSGVSLTTGNFNTAIGSATMGGNFDYTTALTGANNAVLGYGAGYPMEGASSGNSLFGSSAGNTLTTGSNNVCVGYDADVSAATASNQIVIGKGVTGTGNNEIALGNTSISAIKAQVTSITAYSSDERTKKDIEDYDLKGLDFVNDLQLKTYIYKNPADFPDEIRSSKWDEDGVEKPEDPTEVQVGLIAQEVEAALSKHGIGNTETYAPTQDNGIKTLTYGNLIFPLIKAVQELSARVEELESK